MIDIPQSVTSVNGMTGDVVILGGGGIADPGSNGILARTAPNTTSARTITGTTNQITVSNGNGVSGNPTLSLPQNIHTGATPTFGNTNVTSTAAAAFLHINTDSTAGTSKEAQLDLVSGATYARHFYRDSDKNYGFYVNGATRIRIYGATGAVELAGHTAPNADSSLTLGTSSLYWSNTYTDRLYLNSTASLDGSTAGTANLTGALGILATSGSATHSLTLGSTATGIALYNTADQTTNYERAVHSFSGGNYKIETNFGGTGANKNLQLSTISSQFTVAYAQLAAGSFQLARGLSIANTAHTVLSGSQTQSSGTVTMLSIAPTINQTSTASYTALLINPTETSTGSGSKLLIDAQVGGVSKFNVDNTGKMTTATNTINVATAKTPSSATDTGTTGDICWDASYVYVCTKTNTWKRSAIATW